VVVNLVAAGGIGISTVALGLWMLVALGLNLREDRPCGRLRAPRGRLAAFALAAVWAALLGIFWGAIVPFWKSEALVASAETALARRPPDYDAAGAAYDEAIRADHYSTRPWLGLAYLESKIWQARGAKPGDLRWKKIPVLLLEATKDRNPESWTLHHERAAVTADLLRQIGGSLEPGQVLAQRANIVEASRTAMLLYPTNASLHAELAEASADIGMMHDAVSEAKEALRLDALTPHADRKLQGAVRTRLKGKLKEWEKPSGGGVP
jgi:hypothetical protein